MASINARQLLLMDRAIRRLVGAASGGLESAADCHDLLANWARLRRFRPDLLGQAVERVDLDRIDALVRDQGMTIATKALAALRTDAWLAKAEMLDRAYEVVDSQEERSALAEELLGLLDDSQLTLYAARICGVEDADLEDRLDECDAWAIRHADLFVVAGEYVLANACLFRPDLATCDYGLAVTSLKFEELQSKLTEFEAIRDFSDVEAIELRDLLRLVQLRRSEKSAEALRDVLRSWRVRFKRQVIAAAGASVEVIAAKCWEWNSPRVRHRARLVLPIAEAADFDAPMLVGFYDSAGEYAQELVGMPVQFCGVASEIRAPAIAAFATRQILQSDLVPRLMVGAEETAWELVPQESQSHEEPVK